MHPGYSSLVTLAERELGLIQRDELDFEDPSTEQFRTKPVETRAELLQLLEENAGKARRAGVP